jgi:site-specific DNA-methyltransferase (adenine-specific)
VTSEQIGNATLYLGDCLQVLPMLPAVESVITDPPFEADAHTKQRRVMGKGITACRKLDNQPLPFDALTEKQRAELTSWAAQSCSGWFLAFCQAEAIGNWRAALTSAGAKWRRSGVWVKPDGMPQISGDRPAVGHEALAIAWCGTGRSQWNGGGKAGVWISPKSDPETGHGGASNFHPTQKPQRLMTDLVSLFSQPLQLVCDPFMGSGSTGVACANLGRKFIGIEIEPKYFDIACERITAAQAQQRLFA